MENRNLEKALDIVSKLITGEELTERGDNSSLYQEYNNNAEIYDIVHMSLKKPICQCRREQQGVWLYE